MSPSIRRALSQLSLRNTFGGSLRGPPALQVFKSCRLRADRNRKSSVLSHASGTAANAKADRDLVDMAVENAVSRKACVIPSETAGPAAGHASADIMLFKTTTCPNCKAAEAALNKMGIGYTEVYADSDENAELVERLQVMRAPTLVIRKESGVEKYTGVSDIVGWAKAAR